METIPGTPEDRLSRLKYEFSERMLANPAFKQLADQQAYEAGSSSYWCEPAMMPRPHAMEDGVRINHTMEGGRARYSYLPIAKRYFGDETQPVINPNLVVSLAAWRDPRLPLEEGLQQVRQAINELYGAYRDNRQLIEESFPEDDLTYDGDPFNTLRYAPR